MEDMNSVSNKTLYPKLFEVFLLIKTTIKSGLRLVTYFLLWARVVYMMLAETNPHHILSVTKSTTFWIILRETTLYCYFMNSYFRTFTWFLIYIFIILINFFSGIDLRFVGRNKQTGNLHSFKILPDLSCLVDPTIVSNYHYFTMMNILFVF